MDSSQSDSTSGQHRVADATPGNWVERLLPAAAVFVPIDGGNHAQFGYYGDQPGDNPATISRDEQQTQVIAATAALLEEIARE